MVSVGNYGNSPPDGKKLCNNDKRLFKSPMTLLRILLSRILVKNLTLF